MRRPRRIERRETFALPDAPELFDCRWRVPGVMIVCERIYQHASSSDLIAEIDPAAQFGRTVDESSIPSHGLFFDCFAIAQPADARPIGCNRIELQFSWVGHPRSVLQHERNLAVPQKVRKFSVEPISVANLNCKFVTGWQLLQMELAGPGIRGGPERQTY